ncbi:50S ribosomal protein L3 N(5)-glutamine methyltransferase [Rhodopseudomonas boonkerdii]|uniref:50S ribosomal protein L3 N(5)-glutamine methyltransferase n=1 Tax=Rhodopseudomonas boonkerdii TaxID=475937 RepID=UPI001E5DCC8A|nr:50S ribosomal protein L3 N(5)-glutamine methyltransferase [Rhodopseudomonas boonkerdii]UGV25406.1 50S ribosomal protein L3 N(5)-glutamine methyltransferase [Rhodopseudomonas boonkerdii]
MAKKTVKSAAKKAGKASVSKTPAAKSGSSAKTKASVKKLAAANLPKVGPGELVSLLDYVRYATSRFIEAKLAFAHGTTDPVAEAAFIVCELLHLHPDQFENFATARVTAAEGRKILDVIHRRVSTRKPAAYLVNKIYMRGLPFYVDERTIVPRSFIGELLDTHFSGDDGEGASLIDDPMEVASVLDLCTGSGCIAILAAQSFPNAQVDAVDLSPAALAVAMRNVIDYGLDERLTLYRGDLFEPLGGNRYDLIITNPPYVDAQGMADLPDECLAEPSMAFDGGVDGLDIVRRIIEQAGDHLTPHGGLLCEVGRGRANVDAAFPDLPLIWLDTEDSEGEVFWVSAAALQGRSGI